MLTVSTYSLPGRSVRLLVTSDQPGEDIVTYSAFPRDADGSLGLVASSGALNLPYDADITLPAAGEYVLVLPGSSVAVSTIYAVDTVPAHSVRMVTSCSTNNRAFGYMAYGVHAEATEPTGHDGGVFLFRRSPVPGSVIDTYDEFVGICKPCDMEEYPLASATGTTDLTFIRRNTVDIWLRSSSQLETVRKQLQVDVLTLMYALDNLDKLRIVSNERIPN